MAENMTTTPVETTKAHLIRVGGRQVMVQPRTFNVTKPAFYYLEPKQPVRNAESGNDKDSINGPHQVDPNRSASCVAIMPDLKRFRDTGNPYPERGDDPAVVSTERWKQYVPLAHAMFQALEEADEPRTANELLDTAIAISGVGRNPRTGKIKTDAFYVALDTLRDLRLYGMAESDDASAKFKTTRFAVAADILGLLTLDEYEEEQAFLAAEATHPEPAL